MTYKEESDVLYTLKEIKETIRSPAFEQLLKETHENNIMLKQICQVINNYLRNFNQENTDDFNRNVLANLISSCLDINNIFRK